MHIHKKLSLLLNFLFISYIPAINAQAWQDETLSSYGNAQTKYFRDAILGGSAIPEQEAYIIHAQTEKNKFYGRLGLNHSRYTTDGFKNRSGSTASNPPQTIFKTSFIQKASQNRQGLEAAIGYIWSANTRGELELLINRRAQFATHTAVSPLTPFAFNARNKTLLANGYFEYPLLERFCPFISFGLGVTQSRVTNINVNNSNTPMLTVSDVASTYTLTPKNTTSFAYAAGLGVRIKFFSSFSIAGSYRFISLSKLKINGPATNSNSIVPFQKLDAKYNQSMFSISLMYLF